MYRRTSFLISFISVLVLAAGCASSDKQRQSQTGSVSEMPSGNDSNTIMVDRNSLELEDYLRQLPGVTVDGRGNVLVRGVSSIQGDNRPLFVVDDVSVGRNFNSVRNIVDVNNINYVRVLKGAEATLYGIQGGNGVIKITTR